MGFLTRQNIVQMGFRDVGDSVFLSDKASYYNCKNISIGSHVRVDDFSILSAGEGQIVIGNYVHIAAYTSLIGAGKIVFNDFSGTSSRVSIYSSNDDYSGEKLTNPMVPAEFSGVVHADVIVGRHVIIGTGSVVLPGVKLEDGAAVGAMSLVAKDCEPFGFYFGAPARKISDRKRDILALEQKMISQYKLHG